MLLARSAEAISLCYLRLEIRETGERSSVCGAAVLSRAVPELWRVPCK